MSAIRTGALVAMIFATSGCGLSVPEIQENRTSPGDGILMVQAIVQSVRCEIVDSLKDIRDHDLEVSRKYHLEPVTNFLWQWGVQTTLTLTIDEKSSLGPAIVLTPATPATSIFTLAGGGNLAADATRTEKMSFYYTAASLLKSSFCTRGVKQGNDTSLLVQSDLKLEEWLADYLSAIGTHEGQAPTSAKGVLKSTVLSHEIKFDITSTGNITPAWKLTRVNFNQTGTFFSTTRDRTHDLIITLGPGDNTGLTTAAGQNADVSLQIGNAVSTDLKNGLQP